MNKILKISAYALAIVFALLITVVIVLKLIPDNQYRKWIVSAVESSTGRNFSIESLEIDLGSSLRIKTGAVRLANADWAEQADMLSIERLETEVGLLPLLSGTAEISGLLDTANIITQSNESGVSNWDLSFGLPPEELPVNPEINEEETSSIGIRPLIRKLVINDVTVEVFDRDKSAHLAQLRIETPVEETSLIIEADVAGIPVQLDGNLGHIDAALDRASTPINISGTFDQNKLTIEGNWGPVLPELNLDLLFDLQVPSTSSIAAVAGYQIDDIGVLEFTARARADQGLISISDMVTKLDGEETTSSIQGGISNVRSMHGVDIGVELNTEALETLVQRLRIELPVPLPPEVNLSAKLTGGKNGLSISDINANIGDAGLALAMTGRIDNILSSRQIEAEFEGSLDSLSALSKYANLELPDLGAITLSGVLRSEGKALGLRELAVNMTDDNLNLSVTGGVDDVISVDGIEAKLDADIASLGEQSIQELNKLFKSLEVDVPTEYLPQSLQLSSGISGNLEQLSLSDVKGGVADEGVNVSLTGNVENILAPSGIAAEVMLDSDSVASFSKYAGTELPDLGPLKASATVASTDRGYALETLQANLAADILSADLEASVADLVLLEGIEAKLVASTATLASLSDIAKTELPETDPVKVVASLTGENRDQANVSIIAESAEIKAVVESTLAQLKTADDLTIGVSVTAQSLNNFDKLIGKEMPDRGPVDLGASIQINPGRYAVDELKLQVDEQSAFGHLKLELPKPEDEKGITLIHGELDIPYLDLSYLLPEPVPEGELDETGAANETTLSEEQNIEPAPAEYEEESIDEPLAESERLLSSEKILLDTLHDYDIDVAVTAGKINFGKTDLQDLEIKALLKDGLLKIAPIKGVGGEGSIDGSIQIDGRSDTPALLTTITLDQLAMPNTGGVLDFHLDLDGQGQSVAELMAGLNGQMLLVARDGVIEKSFASKFGSGLFSFSGDKNNTNLECAILRVDIVDGVADFEKKLAAQLTEVTWQGGGTIDFNTERLRADIAPKPRKGIPISAGGSLAGLVKLGGTLKNPKVVPDYTDAAFKYGKYSAYVATGGLSLLAEVIANKLTANKDVCGQILDGTVFSAADKAARKNLPK